MKALKILNRAFIDSTYEEVIISSSGDSSDCKLINTMDNIDEAKNEIAELNQILIDLFAAIELSEDEPDEKRFSSIEIYLQRLGKFKMTIERNTSILFEDNQMSNLVPYEDIPEEIKVSLQDEIDKIGDNQKPYYLYHNVVMSTGTTGSLAKIFGLPFGLVLKIKELNNKV